MPLAGETVDLLRELQRWFIYNPCTGVLRWRETRKKTRARKGNIATNPGARTNDAAFIAASRTAVPALIAEVERLQHENATCAATNMVLQDKVRIERKIADGLKAELAALRAKTDATPDEDARKAAQKAASRYWKLAELPDIIAEAITAFAAPHIAARERAERRAQKLWEAIEFHEAVRDEISWERLKAVIDNERGEKHD